MQSLPAGKTFIHSGLPTSRFGVLSGTVVTRKTFSGRRPRLVEALSLFGRGAITQLGKHSSAGFQTRIVDISRSLGRSRFVL